MTPSYNHEGKEDFLPKERSFIMQKVFNVNGGVLISQKRFSKNINFV